MRRSQPLLPLPRHSLPLSRRLRLAPAGPRRMALRGAARLAFRLFLLAAAGSAFSPASASSAAPAAPPSPASDWQRIEPGGGTGCADGSPYAFFVRGGDPERLLLHLQGGGACWSARTCDPAGRPTYDFSVGAADHPDGDAAGILALEDSRNPFRGWTAVFVPYCSGDVHLGNARRRYPLVAGARAAPRFVEIQHRGLANAGAALAWAAAHTDPRRVFVAGESAGAIASPFWAARAAEHFPEAAVAQLGDAAGGYRARAVRDLLSTWGARAAVVETLTFPDAADPLPAFEALYIGAGLRHPGLGLARLDRAEDLVQRFFLSQVGVTGPAFARLLAANLADIRAHVPRVRQFLAPGESHTTLSSPAFYRLEVAGTSLRDWLAAHAAGREVDDVICEGCAPP